MDKLHSIYRDIKEVRTQGAINIAKAALKAYSLKPNKENKKNLIKLRPTEPMLVHVLNLVGKISEKDILNHFSCAQNRINKNIFKIIKSGDKIFTHCHSTNVSKALIYAKRNKKNFEVYNTETRPLYQGRITAKELSKSGIKVTSFIDSAMNEALRDSDIVFLGADAILKSGVINKVGSASIAEISFLHKKPLYIVADSWKFTPENIQIEERNFKEVWKNAPKKIKIRNPAFEKIDKRYITGIISELGILRYGEFLRRMKKK